LAFCALQPVLWATDRLSCSSARRMAEVRKRWQGYAADREALAAA
jgi:hypothetical protein